MRPSWKPLLSLMTEAIDAGWKPADVQAECDSRVRIAGREFEMSRSIGRSLDELSATVYFFQRIRREVRLRRDNRLPSGAEADALNQVSDQMSKLGYRGAWDSSDGLGVRGHFSKEVKNCDALKRELHVLKGLRIGEAKSRRM